MAAAANNVSVAIPRQSRSVKLRIALLLLPRHPTERTPISIGGSIYFIHLPHFARRLSPQALNATLTEVKAGRGTQVFSVRGGFRPASHFPTTTTEAAPISPATDGSNLWPKTAKSSKSTIQWALALNHSSTTGSVTSISPDT